MQNLDETNLPDAAGSPANAGNGGGKPPRRAKQRKLRDQRLYWRGSTIWCRVLDPEGSGTKVRLTTGCKDESAAILVANRYERQAADPTIRAAEETTIIDCIDDYLNNTLIKGLASKETVEKNRHERFGAWRTFCETEKGYDGGRMPLSRVTRDFIDEFFKWRLTHSTGRRDGSTVSAYTIKRQIDYLGYALRHAAERGRFHTPLERVMPSDMGNIGPRQVERRPTPAQFAAIVNGMPSDRQAHLVFLAATGLRKSESQRVRPEDIVWIDDPMNPTLRGTLHVRGTKTARSRATIPITSVMEAPLRWALENAPRTKMGTLFPAYSSMTLQMDRVRRRIPDMPKYSAHDLRRFFTHAHLDAKAPLELVSKLLRHTTTTLVEKLYGNIREPERLAARYGGAIVGGSSLAGLLPGCAEVVPNHAAPVLRTGTNEPSDIANSAEKPANPPEGGSMLGGLHGRSTTGANRTVIVSEVGGTAHTSVPVLYTTAQASEDVRASAGERANEPAFLSPGGGSEEPGTSSEAGNGSGSDSSRRESSADAGTSIAAALALLAQMASRTSPEEREVLDKALSILAGKERVK